MITSSYPLPQKYTEWKSCNNSNTWTYSYSKETSSIYRKTNSISRNTQDLEVLIIFPRNSIFYYTDDPPANVIIYMCKINVEKSVRWPKWWSGKTRQKQLYYTKISPKYLVRLRKTCEILLPINILLFFLCRIYILLNTVDKHNKEVYKQYDTKICNKNM